MYSKGKRSWIKHIDFIFIDIISLEIALILAYAIRFPRQWLFNDVYFAPISGFIILFDVCIAFFTEPYNGILRRNKYQELRHTLLHYSLVFAAVLTHLYAVKISFYYSRQTLFTFIVIAFVIGYILRCIRKRKIRRRKLSDADKNSMIAIVETSTAERCLTNIAHNGYLDFKVGGVIVLDKDMTGEVIQGVPVVAAADSCLSYIRENVVDEVFIDGNSRESAERLANTLVELGLTVHVSLVSSDLLVINRKLETYGSYVCLTSSMRIASDLKLLLKRATDVIGSLVGLIIMGLAFIVFAPIIKIQSPGPVLFKQTRIGRNGRRFMFYKFRTMVVDADKKKTQLMGKNEIQGNMFKIDGDPRIIPIGHFMRKHSIDELPQFLNVLKGDMSLVGTRPPTEEEFEKYENHHKARLGIKPGLTGLWQVSGRSDITDFEEVVRLDTDYIANWSLLLDIKIMFKTLGVVISGKGSR